MGHKHKHDLVDEDESPIIGLDYKRRLAKQVNCNGSGWKFYMSIKDKLPDWWAEFNGAVHNSHDSKFSHSHMRSKYRDARSFALSKFDKHQKGKNKEERQWFQWMISPRKIWERNCLNVKRYEVPWLGDWEARRKNGYWETSNTKQIRYLKDAIKSNINAAEAIRATSPFVVQSLMRLVRLQEKIDNLFNGEPFLDDNPLSSANSKRFKLYMDLHGRVETAKELIYDRWMKVHGVNPEKAETMQGLVQIIQAINPVVAAGAMTGFNPGQFQQMNGEDGKPNGAHNLLVDGQGVYISPDALLLAQHLVKHSQTFRKPLPPIEGEGKVIEAEEVKDAREKSNGHAKAN